MKTDLSHLPHAKQRELGHIVQFLFEEFADAIVMAEGKRKAGRILKIILFGSHARGDWVNEPHTAKGYVSDYDLLVIVNQQELADLDLWHNAEERLIRETQVTKVLRTPANFIVHSLKQVNDALAQGRFFFMDIARDGIALYQSSETELHQPKPQDPMEALEMAQEYFETWFSSAMQRYELGKHAVQREFFKPAAFEFHQAVESLYHCVLLVLTFYTPHRHNIAFLRSLADKLDSRLVGVWPRDDRRSRALFTKLRDAYVKARYSKHYNISAEELEWLASRIEALGGVVRQVCSEKIAELKRTAGVIG
ncbi:HEPN domain-containing protein [Sphingomonas bisphenolicum]|uniref:Nucleotidyltransferase n=1 Tax=Sphingomonas bisphenolicum TaxID=296544 RepID=A0ABM7G7X7_9SPHN|nr:HEPN domain-containing protein [Sphingomonas bisphenolicum]BBF70945.1 nucleotidyltransferase [Sphingomonas bisphenolicum]